MSKMYFIPSSCETSHGIIKCFTIYNMFQEFGNESQIMTRKRNAQWTRRCCLSDAPRSHLHFNLTFPITLSPFVFILVNVFFSPPSCLQGQISSVAAPFAITSVVLTSSLVLFIFKLCFVISHLLDKQKSTFFNCKTCLLVSLFGPDDDYVFMLFC